MTFLANKDLTDRILMHRKVTKSLLKWGKIRFSNSEKQKIRYFEFNEYKRLITNHYSSILAKCYCLLTLFKKAPLTTFYVLFLFIIFKNGKKLNTKRFKVEMVYEVYPSKYPPFKLFLDFIKQNSNLDIGISVFKNTAETPPGVSCMPNFYLRILLQRFFSGIQS